MGEFTSPSDSPGAAAGPTVPEVLSRTTGAPSQSDVSRPIAAPIRFPAEAVPGDVGGAPSFAGDRVEEAASSAGFSVSGAKESSTSQGGPVLYRSQVHRQVEGSISLVLVGDVNGDNIVNRTDLIAVARALGTVLFWDPSGPINLMEPSVDVNKDGVVDVLDMALVAAQLGEQL